MAALPPDVSQIIDPATISGELRALLEEHIQIALDYRKRMKWAEPPRLPLTLIRADADAPDYLNAGSALGWHQVSRGKPEVKVVAGNHSTIITRPGVTALAAAVRACL